MGGEPWCLKVKVTTNEDKKKPPVTGWQHFVGNGKWESDPTLVCSSKLTSVCTEVIVKLSGAAKDMWPSSAGRYLPVKGKHTRGRWVGVY